MFSGKVKDDDDLDNVDESEARVPVEEDRGAVEAQGQDCQEKMTQHQS